MWINDIYPYAFSAKDTKQQKKYAAFENNRQWQDVFNRLFSIAVNIFEWKNLPQTCDPYFFEAVLLWRGKACIIEDISRGGFLSLPCVVSSGQNLYYEHSFWRAVSVGYEEPFMALTDYNKNIFDLLKVSDETNPINKGVVCFDNFQKYPLHQTILIYTNKIVDAMRAIDVCAKQLKIPAIIETDEETKVAISQAVKSIDENLVAVYAGKSVASKLKESKAVQTGASAQNLIALWDHLNNVKSEFLTAFGINNLNTADKKERLLTDEVNSNNDSIALNAAYRLDQRKHFCDNFNSVFGTNISCEIRHEFSEIENNEKVKGDTDGGLYNDAGRSS